MSAPTASTPASTTLRPARIVSWSLVACIMVQAALSGPAWFQDPGLFELHGYLGIATLLLAGVLVVITFLTGLPGWTRVLALLIAVGSFGQIGLGYAGHRGGLAIASSVHVPLGVVLLGAAVAVAVAAHLVPDRTPPST